MQCTQYNTAQSLWSADSRAIIGRMTADIRRLSADGSLIKCHRPTVCRSSADWRPMIGRPSTENMMKKSSNTSSRPNVGRSSGDHRPTLHRWQNPWKSADRSTKLLTWVLRQKSRRPTKKSTNIGAYVGRQSADVARFSLFWLTDRRATVGLGNVTVVLRMLSDRVMCLWHFFWWILQIIVLRTCSLLLKCDELSMFRNILFPLHQLFNMHSTRKVRYRTSHAFPSNRPTEVSLNLVQSRQSNSITTCITFTNAKKTIFLYVIN